MSPPPPPSPAILLLSLPPSLLLGINLLTFTTSARFLGIKDLPPGLHFLYTSETPSHSLRSGAFILIPSSSPATLIVRKWDPASSSLIACSTPEVTSAREKLGGIWNERLTPYRQNAGASSADGMGEGGGGADGYGEEEKEGWAQMMGHVSPALLTRLLGDEDWRITTASCAPQDADHIPGLSPSESAFSERELCFLGIDLKRTWREGAVGRERTEGAIDRSWALEDVERRWKGESEGGGDVVLGEMEVCFLMVMTVANWSCLEEWKRVLGVVLTCKRAVRGREEWFVTFLGLLRRQLQRGGDVEGGLFDMADEGGGYLKGLLRGFKRTLGAVFEEGEGEDLKEEMEGLEGWLRGEYGWELGDETLLRKGMLELEDGEMVEMEMDSRAVDGEEETGEYAPVVVEL